MSLLRQWYMKAVGPLTEEEASMLKELQRRFPEKFDQSPQSLSPVAKHYLARKKLIESRVQSPPE